MAPLVLPSQLPLHPVAIRAVCWCIIFVSILGLLAIVVTAGGRL
jgi:hypothetical protein